MHWKPFSMALLVSAVCCSCFASSASRIASSAGGTYAGKPLYVSAVVHGITRDGHDLSAIWIKGASDGAKVLFDFVEAVKHELKQSISRKLEDVRFVNNLEIGIPDRYDATFQVEQYQDYMKKIELDGLFVVEFSSLQGLCSNTTENVITASLFIPPIIGWPLWGLWTRVACEIHIKGDFTIEFYDVAKGEVTHGYNYVEVDIGGVGTRNPKEITGAHLREGFSGFATIFDHLLDDFPM